MLPQMKILSRLALSTLLLVPVPQAEGDSAPFSAHLDLPVVEIRNTHPPYADYCLRHPDHCDLSGPTRVVHAPGLLAMLDDVNAAANRRVDCSVTDSDLYGQEEYWAYPEGRFGDCEDIALFKREELVHLGLPRGALTLALVHHRVTMTPHAVLLVETTAGTYLLDTLSDPALPWHEAPYNFEARERPDGRWDRYDQEIWRYERGQVPLLSGR